MFPRKLNDCFFGLLWVVFFFFPLDMEVFLFSVGILKKFTLKSNPEN